MSLNFYEDHTAEFADDLTYWNIQEALQGTCQEPTPQISSFVDEERSRQNAHNESPHPAHRDILRYVLRESGEQNEIQGFESGIQHDEIVYNEDYMFNHFEVSASSGDHESSTLSSDTLDSSYDLHEEQLKSMQAFLKQMNSEEQAVATLQMESQENFNGDYRDDDAQFEQVENISRVDNLPKGEIYKIDLNQFHSIGLTGFKIYTPKLTRIRNLRYVFGREVPLFLQEFTEIGEVEAKQLLGVPGIHRLEQFRQRNNFTLEDCQREHASSLEGEAPIANATYTEHEVPEPRTGYLYTPKIRRTYDVIDEESQRKSITEGLCPYCPTIKFGKLKNSNYGHHLSILHGVQTNGNGIPEPVSYGLYYYEKLNKQNWSNKIFEGVLCPVDGCLTVCKVSKAEAGSESKNRLLDYLRHYKSSHKSGRLLDLMRRNAERNNRW